jgi:hypothetical protein
MLLSLVRRPESPYWIIRRVIGGIRIEESSGFTNRYIAEKLRAKRENELRRGQRADRYRGVCECGEHAWAVLTKGFVTLVSLKDAHHLQGRKWCAKRAGRVVYAGCASTALHRVIFGESVPDELDHGDHDGLNNRRSNLRPATHSPTCQSLLRNFRQPRGRRPRL